MAGSVKRGVSGPGVAFNGGTFQSTGQSPSLDRAIQAQIGDKLRAMYGELVEQPVPDRFSQILSRLAQKGDGGTNA